jgi:hypothetical protein
VVFSGAKGVRLASKSQPGAQYASRIPAEAPPQPPAGLTGAWDTDPTHRAEAGAKYDKLPMSFEANGGQTDNQVKFLARGADYAVFLTNQEAVLTLQEDEKAPAGRLRSGRHSAGDKAPVKSSTLHMALIHANPNPQVAGIDELPGKTSYVVGRDRTQWQNHLDNFGKVKYTGVYPGIDMVYYGNQEQLEYDFVVAPGADTNAIRLEMKDTAGPVEPNIAENGDLKIHADGSEIRFHRPVIYQLGENTEKNYIDGKFVIATNHQVGFEIADYDHSKSLVIDPATYLGGSNFDQANAVAYGAAGVYVTGFTRSANFPGTTGRTSTRTDADAFIALLSTDMSTLIHATYFGGTSDDVAESVAVGTSGVYIAGHTNSSDLPGTSGSFQMDLDGASEDGFVALFSTDLGTLERATYYGAIGDEYFMAMCLAGGKPYVTGYTTSASLPRVAGGAQPRVKSTITGNTTLSNAFAVEFTPDLTWAVNATFLGGYLGSQAWTIASSADGNSVYIGGDTQSDDFPVLANAQQSNPQDQNEEVMQGFVSQFESDLSVMTASTYVGGGHLTLVRALAVSGQNVYVAGNTQNSSFPFASGGAQPHFGGLGGTGQGDGFIGLYTADLSKLTNATYVGGSGDDNIFAIAVSGTYVYVAGQTNSTNLLGTSGATQPANGGGYDAFVGQFGTTLQTWGVVTYLGGPGQEAALGLAVRTSRSPLGSAADQVFVAGYTNSGVYSIRRSPLLLLPVFPATAGALQTANGGQPSGANPYDAFVASYSYSYQVKCTICLPNNPAKPAANAVAAGGQN